MTKAEFMAQTVKQRNAINPNASLADIGTIVSEALSRSEEGDTLGAGEALFDLHSLIYPNSSYTATPEENAKITAHEPPAWTPCQSGDCDPSCNVCDEGKYVSKKAQFETKLLNLKSYARLIGCSLEDTATGETLNMSKNWRVMTGDTWNDCFLMLSHIDDTLAELLPE
jgi:hypothetical protein